MKSKLLVLFGALIACCVSGCVTAFPVGYGGCHGPCPPFYAPCRPCRPQLHLHYDPCEKGQCRPSARVEESECRTMPITVEPTGLTGRSLLGVAKLVSATTQFRTEAGGVSADAALEFCYFPDYPFDDQGRQIIETSTPITAPLALITQDNDSQVPLIERPFKRLATGETMLQLALKVDGTKSDHRDQALDAMNRFDAIMQQVLQLGAERSTHWWVTKWRLDEGSALNNLAKFPFVDAANNPVRVRIFRTVLTWQA